MATQQVHNGYKVPTWQSLMQLGTFLFLVFSLHGLNAHHKLMVLQQGYVTGHQILYHLKSSVCKPPGSVANNGTQFGGLSHEEKEFWD